MRIRTVKPEFWLHEGLCGCSDFTRLMAIALLNWADDHGYFMAHPSLLRGGLFPFLDDSKKIPGTLQDLSRVGWIQLGIDNQGRPVGRILNFTKHQRVDKPQSSRIKDLCIFQDDSGNDLGSIQEPSKEEGNGMEQGTGKGKDTPIAPKGAGKKDSNIPSSPEAITLAEIVHRKSTTPWTAVEINGFKKLLPIDPDDLASLKEYYDFHWPPERDVNVLRHDLKTLLNNFPGEVDRAKVWESKPLPTNPYSAAPLFPTNRNGTLFS